MLQKLHDKGDSNHIAAKEEFYQIRKQLELEKETGVQTFMQMVKRPSYRKRIYCGVLVQFAAQSTGVLVINNYQILLCTWIDSDIRLRHRDEFDVSFRCIWLFDTNFEADTNLGLSGWLPLLLCR